MNAEQLLGRLEESLLDGETAIEVSLRTARLLAEELDVPDMAAWCKHELGGYASQKDVPEYRKLPQFLIGLSVGPFDRKIENHQVDLSLVDPQIRELVMGQRYMCVTNAVGEVLAWTTQPELRRPLQPPELVSYLRSQFLHHQLIDVVWVSSGTQMLGVIGAVSDKLVDLVAAFKKLNKVVGLNHLPSAEANAAFHNCIFNIGEGFHMSQDQIKVRAQQGSTAVGKQVAGRDANITQTTQMDRETPIDQSSWEAELVEIISAIVTSVEELQEQTAFFQTTAELKKLEVEGKKIDEIYEMICESWTEEKMKRFRTWHQKIAANPKLLAASGVIVKELVGLAEG